MMYIIFDTNIVLKSKDYFFEEKMRTLTSLNRFDDVEVCIPEVVKDEIIKKYLENTNTIKQKIKSIEDTSKGMHLFEENEIKTLNLNKKFDEYKYKLDIILENQNIKVLEYLKDGSYIKDLMKKVIFNKAPFFKNANSYRDCFIWYIILDLLEKSNEYDEIIFITENVKDFFDSSKNNLHENLVTDLKGKSNFTIYSSMDDFLKNNESINALKITEQDEKLIHYLNKNLNNEYNRNIIIENINKNIDIETEISDYIEGLTIYFDENFQYESYVSLDYIYDNIKFNNNHYEKFNELEGVINLNFEVNINYTKFFKNPTYDSAFDESEEEFIYKFENFGTIEMQVGVYLSFYNPEDVVLDLEYIFEKGSMNLDYIGIKVLN